MIVWLLFQLYITLKIIILKIVIGITWLYKKLELSLPNFKMKIVKIQSSVGLLQFDVWSHYLDYHNNAVTQRELV